MRDSTVQKRRAAKDLFLSGYTQREIAAILLLSEHSIGKWASQDSWKAAKLKTDLMETNTILDLMDLFQFQVECLKARKREMEEIGEIKGFAPGEFDALQKLYSTIKPSWNNFRTHVEVLKAFMEYLAEEDAALAKGITDIADRYINEKRKLA